MVLFISIKTLKERYLIDNNLDDKYILSLIQKGQDFYIKPAIGRNRYNELLTQIKDEEVTPENVILLKEYIEPALSYFVLSEAVYAIAYKFKNNPEDLDKDYNNTNKIAQKYLNDSKHYVELLKAHVCSGKDTIYKTGIYID